MKKISKKYFNVKARRRFYLRFFFSTVILVLLLLLFKNIFSSSFSFSEDEVVNYKEVGNVDYKVYLKENDFYDKPYLEKNMAYVASLINKIDVDFAYNFNVDKKSDLDIKYSIIGNLVISSQSKSNVFFEKKYVLKEDKIGEMNNETNYNINDNVVIDYEKYNNLVNKFRTDYAVSTNSYLDVYLQVEEVNKATNSYKLVNISKTSLKIPLSQQEVNINLNGEKLDNEQKIVTTNKYVVKDNIGMTVSLIVFAFLFLYLIYYLSRVIMLFRVMSVKDNKYDKYVKRLLKCYDRVIVNVNSVVDLDKYDIINVADFQELVDVRDNVKEPINYYVIEEHESCLFYIVHNCDVYLYSLSLSDLEEE